MTQQELLEKMKLERENYRAALALTDEKYRMAAQARRNIIINLEAENRNNKVERDEKMKQLRAEYNEKLRELENEYRTARYQRAEVSHNQFNGALRIIYRFIEQREKTGIRVNYGIDEYIDIRVCKRDTNVEPEAGEDNP